MDRTAMWMLASMMLATGCGEGVAGEVPYGESAPAKVVAAAAQGAKPTTTSTKPSRKSSTTAAASYTVRTTDATGSAPVWSTSFSLATTYDLFHAVDVPASFSGSHTLALELFEPSGNVYQRFTVAFATDVAAAPGEQQAEAVAEGWRVWVHLPVAGTFITQYQLTGTWTAHAFLDGAATAQASNSFNLTQ